ncbi:MAG: lipopolysaccharide assembly protein LapA domain-containing protein [Silicimonas sp.]
MRYVRYLVLGVIAVVLIIIAVANRGPLTLRLLPVELEGLFGLSWQVTLPAFLILLAAVLVGVLLGFVWEWVREHRFRAEAVAERRERERLEREIRKTAPRQEKGDDVLALLESR